MLAERPPITHVAIRVNGKVFSLPPPFRHHHILYVVLPGLGVSYRDANEREQGFLDASGRYLTRRQAMVSAKLNGQFKPGHPTCAEELYSEDLW